MTTVEPKCESCGHALDLVLGFCPNCPLPKPELVICDSDIVCVAPTLAAWDLSEGSDD